MNRHAFTSMSSVGREVVQVMTPVADGEVARSD
jgi:hypothetical protein